MSAKILEYYTRYMSILVAGILITCATVSSGSLRADEQIEQSDEDTTVDQYSARVDVLKTRMLNRLKLIDQLKTRNILGEDKFGYLAPTPPNEKSLDAKQVALVKEENDDRKEIYNILAKRTNTTLLQVQDVRAKMIRDKSKKGMWLQDTKGRWYQKR